MKILTVAIPNHHFFQWVNQLEHSGHEVFWFDITDGGPPSSKIPWVTQIKGWKLRWDFPLRSSIKSKLPNLYKKLQERNENDVVNAFAKAYQNIQPDIIHCFEMQLAGIPILSVLQEVEVPLIYSSWGSDIYDFKRLGLTKQEVSNFLKRANYLITDCKRDQTIAQENGFKGKFLGVFPGNGGLDLDPAHIKSTTERNTILIKGYDDGVGKASVVLQALELVDKNYFNTYDIVLYSVDRSVEEQIRNSQRLSDLISKVFARNSFVKNTTLLELMGSSSIHVANSLSDGMPNALLEAMGMGAFPIQSNPGKVTEEVIQDGKNGLLIHNPLDVEEIAGLIEKAITDESLRKNAQDFNTQFILKNYNRSILRPQIIDLYKNVYNHSS
ncbi:glycosyltransferase [Dokdonia sinensis]|uniref:Glycosyltransferase n=1 Tax=Dokdonia sinensis TaxID=2479847 RepID=A0A3M0FXJ0_9FLAO|nr:glycosyltransferase family 4 protein [Dokdonia sinensis]RMB57421.1 glycosyltransferase [Dokdonia sinensis]